MSSSNKVSQLQNKIIQIKKELSEINKDEKPLPEFIDATNMLRSNEYLQKANDTKSTLLAAYEEYTSELENLISSVSKIKGNIASLKSRIKPRTKPKKKVKKKRSVKRKTKPKTRRRKTKPKTRRRKSRTTRR
jgi:predicted  nucleic acid-binding Zn-ribbon protein